RGREGVLEPLPVDELQREGGLVRLQLLLPVALSDDYVPPDPLRVGQELVEPDDGDAQLMRAAEAGGPRRISVGNLVDPLDEIAGLLELDREEEGRRDVDAADRQVGGRRVRAVRHLASPEGEARRVRLADEEVV